MTTLRLHITGAACSGVTTLGETLAAVLGAAHVDSDDFYWMPTDPPFSTKRAPQDRVRLMADALGEEGWVLSGSLMGWGDSLVEGADLIVFVDTPTALRMERLRRRERERFGERILPGGDMHAIHTDFVAWAERYDDPNFAGRSRARHEAWLGRQSAPLLRLDGREEPRSLAERVLAAASPRER
ncbi:adenylate kinase [Aureimonas populi]|uniref:Adenylate kinase n=2 Tax=Aureimonas populi TaxID=1701758 RepID=A0ABW5CGC2_9HYPH